MNDEINISDSAATLAQEVIITEARPSGWMAWYRFSQSDYFNQVYDHAAASSARDYYRCPYPLFPTREDAIESARHCLRERGGEVRVVKVTL